MTDAISMNYQRVCGAAPWSSVRSLIYRLELPRVGRFERAEVAKHNLVSLVGEPDRLHLLGRQADRSGELVDNGQRGSLRVFGNGVDSERLRFHGPGDDQRVVFIGNMRSMQNQDACRFFIKEVLPILLADLPQLVFHIVGSIDPRVMNSLSHPNVRFSGRVHSIAAETAGAMCAVCPVRIGAGVQNKVLEYLSLGLPCVVSDVGLEGLELEPGKHLLCGDTAEAIASKIRLLVSDRELRHNLALSGRRAIESRFTWEEAMTPYLNAISSMLGDSPYELDVAA